MKINHAIEVFQLVLHVVSEIHRALRGHLWGRGALWVLDRPRPSLQRTLWQMKHAGCSAVKKHHPQHYHTEAQALIVFGTFNACTQTQFCPGNLSLTLRRFIFLQILFTHLQYLVTFYFYNNPSFTSLFSSTSSYDKERNLNSSLGCFCILKHTYQHIYK